MFNPFDNIQPGCYKYSLVEVDNSGLIYEALQTIVPSGVSDNALNIKFVTNQVPESEDTFSKLVAETPFNYKIRAESIKHPGKIIETTQSFSIKFRCQSLQTFALEKPSEEIWLNIELMRSVPVVIKDQDPAEGYCWNFIVEPYI